MKPRSLFLILLLVIFILIILYSFYPSGKPENYVEQIKQEREQKDDFMRSSADSPFKGAAFQGLKYFPVDQDFRVNAQLLPIENKHAIMLATSDGYENRYLEFGYALFDKEGIHNKLLILEIMDEGPRKGDLFLAFGDETSGNETYGAGRYLDLKKVPAANSLVLDFNKAYNPYCAYSNSYSCPLPPRQNLLKIAIRAGERVYHP